MLRPNNKKRLINDANLEKHKTTPPLEIKLSKPLCDASESEIKTVLNKILEAYLEKRIGEANLPYNVRQHARYVMKELYANIETYRDAYVYSQDYRDDMEYNYEHERDCGYYEED